MRAPVAGGHSWPTVGRFTIRHTIKATLNQGGDHKVEQVTVRWLETVTASGTFWTRDRARALHFKTRESAARNLSWLCASKHFDAEDVAASDIDEEGPCTAVPSSA